MVMSVVETILLRDGSVIHGNFPEILSFIDHDPRYPVAYAVLESLLLAHETVSNLMVIHVQADSFALYVTRLGHRRWRSRQAIRSG